MKFNVFLNFHLNVGGYIVITGKTAAILL